MTDRENVIKALEEAIQHYERYSGDEYGREYDFARVEVETLEDAIVLLKEDERAIKHQSEHLDALLKAQEPVKPILQSGGNYVCGNCGMHTVGFTHPLTGESVQTWKYCGSCGKKVRWE